MDGANGKPRTFMLRASSEISVSTTANMDDAEEASLNYVNDRDVYHFCAE
jgi:hypothetical protein